MYRITHFYEKNQHLLVSERIRYNESEPLLERNQSTLIIVKKIKELERERFLEIVRNL